MRLRAWLALRLAARRIARSGLFDEAWYRRTYPDLAREPNPALHYLRRGAAEGRSPGPGFDGPWYLAQHPEALLRDANPLLHYLDTGRANAIRAVQTPPPAPAMPLDDAHYALWLGANEPPAPAPPAGAPTVAIATTDALPDADYIVFAAPHLRLHPDAQAAIRAALAADPAIDVLYADQDRIGPDGTRSAPLFKPPFDPDWFAERDLIGHAAAFRRALLQPGDNADPWAAALRIARAGGRVAGLPRVLFHALPDAPPPRTAPPIAALLPDPPPLVSLIVPTRDRAALLARCADGVLNRTDYPEIEFIVVDNDSREPETAALLTRLQQDPRVRVLPFAGPFNWSAMNNAGAEAARGEVLVLLNNDIDVIEPGWLRELVTQALRPEIGAVGAKLLYPDGTVQHAGMALGQGASATHLCRHAARDDPGHAGMLAARRRVSAVTGACLAIRRDVYWRAGGIEAEHLRVTGSDADLCLRVRALGRHVLFTPHALLFHLEAASRGLDATEAQRARMAAERAYLLQRWGRTAETEAFLSPNLTVVQEQLALAPR
ncbi:MAG: glycosyltransferase [Proteobacteria bacterium]|nr:glycosyltransferase [Pseudomonadota bacterium]